MCAQVYRSTQQLEEDKQRSGDSLDLMLKETSHQEDNHLAQWVRNSHQIPPPDSEVPIEEWTPEELAARTPKEVTARDFSEGWSRQHCIILCRSMLFLKLKSLTVSGYKSDQIIVLPNSLQTNISIGKIDYLLLRLIN